MKANSVLEPIDSRYSKQLNDLIHSMLQLLPADRPNINNVMAMPIVVNAHMNLPAPGKEIVLNIVLQAPGPHSMDNLQLSLCICTF